MTSAGADGFFAAKHRYLVLVATHLVRGIAERLVRVLVDVLLARRILLHLALHGRAIAALGPQADLKVSQELSRFLIDVRVERNGRATLNTAALGED